MSKFFTNLPDSLEQYNPDAIPKEWYRGKTFDEQGRWHSFNDVPILIQVTPKAIMRYLPDGSKQELDEFRWYKHGEIYRSGNRPPIIKVCKNFYSTFNEQGLAQSYNGMPANFQVFEDESFSLDWFEEGTNHRGGDLPLSIIVDITGNLEYETYGFHGIPHRGNNLPADSSVFSKTWLVQGVMHNSQGYAELIYPDEHVWALYGVEISEKLFKQIETACNKTNLPIWVSFLKALDIISKEHLDAFMDSSGIWDTDVPVSWLLNLWNITDVFFENKINELVKQNSITLFNSATDETIFTSFLNVIKFEEKEAGKVSQQEGKNV